MRELLAELIKLSASIQRCAAFAKQYGDEELANALRQMGWTAAECIACIARADAFTRRAEVS